VQRFGRLWLCGAAIASITGCDYAFRIDHIDKSGTDAVTDDGSIEAPPDALFLPLCASRRIDETFMSFPICGTMTDWQSEFELNVQVAQSNSQLRITPTSSNAQGGCDSVSVPFTNGGVAVRVSATLTGIAAFTGFHALGGINASIQVNQNELKFETYDASTTFAERVYLGADAMAWWRLRPDRAMGQIIAEYSADGTFWLPLGSTSSPPPADVHVKFIAGVSGPSFGGTAVFERVIVCD